MPELLYQINPNRNVPWDNIPPLPIRDELWQTTEILQKLGDAKAALGKLQTVTNVGQSATDDDAHGVGQITGPHLILNVGSKHTRIRGNKATALGIVSRQTKILLEILLILAGCKYFSDSHLRHQTAVCEF